MGIIYIYFLICCCGNPGGWEVVIKPGNPNGRVQLRNNISKGIFIGVTNNGGTCASKEHNKFSLLDVVIHQDNYVSFRSAHNPAFYVRFVQRGGAGLPRDGQVMDDAAKFFVRSEVMISDTHQNSI